jgi:hypothetical protein
MNDFAIFIVALTWLYFGAYGYIRMWRLLGKPEDIVIWVISLLSIGLVVFGPVFMQAVYEAEIELLEEGEECNEPT